MEHAVHRRPLPSPQRRRLTQGLIAVLGLPGLAGLPGRARAAGAATLQRRAGPLLGTRVELVVAHPDAAQCRQALDLAWAEMARLEGLMSRYRADSQVSALARAAGRQAVPVSPELMAVLRQARQLAQSSQGAFDISVGAYSDWGFDPGQEAIPRPEDIQRQRRLVNFRDIDLDEINMTAYLRRPGMRLDLGGIAKLPILAAGMACLRSQGLRDALVNGGGDVLASGQLEGRDWRVGVRDPLQPQRLIGVLGLSDAVLASSGDYERCFQHQGRRYHHVLDPRSGWPSQGAHGVALLAREVGPLNGLGAAIMVAGRARAQQWLAQRSEVRGLLVDEQGLWQSPGLPWVARA